jgi:isopentenyl diphosphate isomerase/L-lactate dehydrogenase-like FMN-dependent dehydrogenase
VLDGAIAPIEILGRIADDVGDRTQLLVDSGFIRGSDIAKGLALGAKAVMIGRAPLWGVAAGGQAGAARALNILSSELDRVMAYLGCNSLSELGEECLAMRGAGLA